MPAQRILFDKTADFKGRPYRNITTLRESEDLFDDLTHGDENASAIAAEAEMRVKGHPVLRDSKIIQRGFHYTRSIIDYPFKNEPYLFTRFGDGTYGVWYGSLEMKTTVFETSFHMIKAESAVEGLDEVVVRERAVYRVKCSAILIDLGGKQNNFPELIADDYGFTQQIGQRMNREGHPGLLAPSSRYKERIWLSSTRMCCQIPDSTAISPIFSIPRHLTSESKERSAAPGSKLTAVGG